MHFTFGMRRLRSLIWNREMFDINEEMLIEFSTSWAKKNRSRLTKKFSDLRDLVPACHCTPSPHIQQTSSHALRGRIN